MNIPKTKDILETFRGCYQDAAPPEKRFCLDPKEQVYYCLTKKGDGYYHLEFWIGTYANQRNILHKDLKRIFASPNNQREYTIHTWHIGSCGVSCLRPAITLKEMKNDLDHLRQQLTDIETSVCGASETFKDPIAVGIGEANLHTLLGCSLNIPDYQRAYCWEKSNILSLLEDLARWQRNHRDMNYRIGTIVLKEQTEGNYDVIDGQQRLITMALFANKGNNILLGSNNRTKKAISAIENAKRIVDAWANTNKSIDLEMVTLGVIVIGRKKSEDLSFSFFNHLNSSGVPLTDYELLKGHHLRYVKEDGAAELMAKRWNSLDRRNCTERLLHMCLFRIRKWIAKDSFSYKADCLDTHDLFHEFSLGFEPVHGLCTSLKPAEINSLLSGGIEFFDYVEHFRVLFERFMDTQAAKDLCPLQKHSYGTLYEGILALSFLFYCKFGDIYLKEAAYAIAWSISRLRNEARVERAYVGNRPEFQKVATIIVRATHEGEVLGDILNPSNRYEIGNRGTTAAAYWTELREVAGKLQGESSTLAKNSLNYISSLTKCLLGEPCQH